MTEINAQKPFEVIAYTEDEETGKLYPIAHLIYANEALADECIAAITAQVNNMLAPEYAKEAIKNIHKVPHILPVPLTNFDSARDIPPYLY